MGCIFGIVGLLFPRILIVVLWFFTDWFDGVFDTVLWPLLGFLFLPITTLWYSVVVNYYAGQWNSVAIIGMVVAIVLDLGATGGSYRSRRRR